MPVTPLTTVNAQERTMNERDLDEANEELRSQGLPPINWSEPQKGYPMVAVRMVDGHFEIYGREKNERMIVLCWPCTGQLIRRLAPDSAPKAWVDEVADFADGECALA